MYPYKGFYITRVVYLDFVDRKGRYDTKSLYRAVTKTEPEKKLLSMMVGHEVAEPRDHYYCDGDEEFIDKRISEVKSYIDVVCDRIYHLHC